MCKGKKILRALLSFLVYIYESQIAPKFLSYLYWPVYKFCKFKKIYFLVNIASGTGHIIAEVDNFMRQKILDIAPLDGHYIFLKKKDPFSTAIVMLYASYFYKAFASHTMYFLLLPLLSRYKEITIDCGLSRLKWHVSKINTHTVKKMSYYGQISKKDELYEFATYCQRCAQTLSYFPLKNIKEDPQKHLPFLKGKVALIHIKENICNATAMPTDPVTFIPSIKALQSLGYFLVFAGREKCPEIFLEFSVFNYAESKWASFYNDILLFCFADIAIISGSGISFLADRFDTPYLYINSWHLEMAMPSVKCITVPTLVKKEGNYLSFQKQMELYASLDDWGGEIFPKNYTARNSSSDEILEGLKELLQENQPMTPLQKAYRNLSNKGPLYFAQSKCSSYFLQKYKNLL